MRKPKFTLTVLASTAAVLLAGCLNYKLGTTLPKHLRSVYVETFHNATKEPQLDTKITSAVIREFQRDGQLKVKDANEADIIVTGNITQYKLNPMRSNRNNPKAVLQYKAIVSVTLYAVERKTGKNITTESVVGSKTFEVKGDLMTARRTILPEVAQELGRKVVDAVISAW
jgi:hypothetical protein